MTDLRKEIEIAINRCSAENGSNTPDFILAQFLWECLNAFDRAVNERAAWSYAALKHTNPPAVDLHDAERPPQRGDIYTSVDYKGEGPLPPCDICGESYFAHALNQRHCPLPPKARSTE